jgi:ubiquinone/menaquinone biosynthesis C-methylase UbiE
MTKGVSTILDVGCGTGPIAELIWNNYEWDRHFVYKGTDYSPAMIEVCHNTWPTKKEAFEVQDARNLKEKNDSWECVLLMHCLDHLDDYKAAISEAARVSSKYVLIVLWRPFLAKGENLNSVNTMGKVDGEKPWEDTHLHEYSKELLEDEFRRNNLGIELEEGGNIINDATNNFNYIWLLWKR